MVVEHRIWDAKLVDILLVTNAAKMEFKERLSR